MALWVVRAGEEGEQEERVLANNVVAIGWNNLGNLSKYPDFLSLFDYFKSIHPKEEHGRDTDYEKSSRLQFGEVWAFIKKIEIGDFVVLPSKKTENIFIGKILGEYEYKQYTDNIKHTRQVKWLKTIKKSEVPQLILNSFNTGLTVFNVEKNDAENFIQRVLEDSNIDQDNIKTPREIIDFIENKMQMVENYQPVTIKTLAENGGSTSKQTVFTELKNYNPDSDSQYMLDTVIQVLKSHNIIRQEGDTLSLNINGNLDDYDTKVIVEKCNEAINNFKGKKNLQNKFNCWIWSVTPENWEIVKEKKIWASRIGQKIRDRVRPGDKVIFYVQGTNEFQGIFEFVEEWYDARSPVWSDETDSVIYQSQIKLETIVLGSASVYDIAQELKMFQNPDDKRLINLVLKGAGGYPSNNGKPIIYQDYERLLELMNDFTTDVFLSEKDFENMVNAIPLVVEYNKNKLQSDKTIPKAEDVQLCARMQYYCALGVTDLLKLTSNDIDLKNYEIHLDPKNKTESSKTATIHPSIKKELEEYVKTKSLNEILFSLNRQILWTYYKKSAELAKLNLFKKQTEREIAGASTEILKQSRCRHMWEKGASEGLIRLKLRLNNKDAIFKSEQPTLQELKNWERREYENTLNVIKTNSNYFLLRHKIGSSNQWRDDIGKQYHFGKIPNYKKLIPGTKTIWYDRQDGDFYFWGYGEISRIEKESDEHFHAHYDNFIFFNEPEKANPRSENVILKKGSNSIKEKILNLPTWNHQISMPKITKEIYDEIVNGKIVSQFSEITPTRSVSDGNLRIPTKDEVKKGIKEIQKELLIDDSIIEEIVTHLASGRHVLLAGPVGTGKTRLSQLIPEMFWIENNGYFADVRTATADWNTQDVIGGISPKIQEGTRVATYEIENGCVTDTILANYEKDSRNAEKPLRHTSIHTVNNKKREFNGTWLVIDEFNRADIDKAFGQLFTALEYHKLIIPDIISGKSTRTIPIPKDYRIIGTLNTADKHYLFNLSDALKRRFAYVEVSIPLRTDKNKEREIYLATKNGLNDLDSEKFADIVKVHENPDSIEYLTDKVKNNIEYSYNVLELIREFKPLGTAILKAIYQTLLVSEKMENEDSFDNAINANLMPQLETLPKTSLEMLHAYLFGNVVDSLEKENQKEQYKTGLESILRYLNYSKEQIKTHLDEFVNERLPNDLADAIGRMKDTRKISFPEKSLFKKSLEEIIKQSEF